MRSELNETTGEHWRKMVQLCSLWAPWSNCFPCISMEAVADEWWLLSCFVFMLSRQIVQRYNSRLLNETLMKWRDPGGCNGWNGRRRRMPVKVSYYKHMPLVCVNLTPLRGLNGNDCAWLADSIGREENAGEVRRIWCSTFLHLLHHSTAAGVDSSMGLYKLIIEPVCT